MISCDPEIMIHWCRLCRRAALRCEELARRSGSQDSRPNLWSRFGSACQLSCFELMFPNLLRKFDAADGDCCRLESFKSEHWSNPYLLDRIRTRCGIAPADFSSVMARCEAAYASRVMTRGVGWLFIALRKNRLAAATSRHRHKSSIWSYSRAVRRVVLTLRRTSWSQCF